MKKLNTVMLIAAVVLNSMAGIQWAMAGSLMAVLFFGVAGMSMYFLLKHPKQ